MTSPHYVCHRLAPAFLFVITLVFVAGCGSGEPAGSAASAEHVRDMSEPTSVFAENASTGDHVRYEPASPSIDEDGSSEDFVELRRVRQSGLLTAGSFDDVANFSDYVQFLRRHHREAQHFGFRVHPASQQTVISVCDVHGKGIGNVRCVVSDPGSQQVLLDGKTGTDGRLMLLTSGETDQQQRLQLQVFAGSQQTLIANELRSTERRWDVVVSEVAAEHPNRLDLCLVVDTTGSMGDELDYLKAEIDSIAQSVHRMFPHVDQRYSLITYRDRGDDYVCRTFDFTASLSDFRRQLDAESAAGGGDFPEAMDVALDAAGQLNWRSGNVARALFLVGDAPPHQQRLQQAVRAVEKLGQLGVRMFPIAASGVESTAEVMMRTASLLTMGQYLFLTDHSGVGHAHATPDVPEFAVERLDQLMVRMIASELAGKRLAAQEVIAIEQGERYSRLPTEHGRHHNPSIVMHETPEPHESGSLVYCGVTVVSPLERVMGWIARHVVATFVAMVAGVLVFDRLTRIHSREL